MAKAICTVPAASTTKAQLAATEATFKSIYAEHFGAKQNLTVLWMRTPAGQTFQAGNPADIFLAMIEVENGLDQARREPAMWAFTNSWAEILGVDVTRLMVTCADATTVSGFLQGNRNRLRPASRLWFMLTTIVHLAQSRRREGFATLRANL